MTDPAIDHHAPAAPVASRARMLQAAGFTVSWACRADAVDGYLTPFQVHRYRHDGDEAFVNLQPVARDEDGAGQSDTIDRSNYRQLTAAYPDTFVPISYINVDVLAAFVSDCPDALVTVLCDLATGDRTFDEDDVSAIEDEEVTASWEQYVAADLWSMLGERACEAWARLGLGAVTDLFWAMLHGLDYSPEHTGLEVSWDYDKIAGPLAHAVLSVARNRPAPPAAS